MHIRTSPKPWLRNIRWGWIDRVRGTAPRSTCEQHFFLSILRCLITVNHGKRETGRVWGARWRLAVSYLRRTEHGNTLLRREN